MIYFEDWWKLGENAVKTQYNGELASDKKIGDVIIYNQESFNKFIDCIALNINVYNSNTDKYELQINKNDPFLNRKNNLDFNKQILFVFSNVKVDQILYSALFDCYLIYFDQIQVEENTYSAVVVKNYNAKNGNYKYQLMNDKPKAKKSLKPQNDNDDY